ncbi:hypothetical protein MLD38_012208 [Melastoma candidum]|uniref:Uncharacterized protein n=1 Tax=Melastoma candidum TaxID=119954 RepID=A0ACB9R5N4_9MYRT|nr:hypothetical protein MLD38_012208 [Melastoma candidum]
MGYTMEGKKPYLAALLVQAIYACMFLLSKAAFDVGMNNFVFVFYRQTTATVFLAPLAIYFEWKGRPRMSFLTFCKIFFISLCGITLSLDIYGVALVYTNATLAASITNTLPVITFFLAVLLRMETLKLRSLSGLAKLVGTMLCLGGAAVFAFYKGPSTRLWSHHSSAHDIEQKQDGFSGTTWIKGCFLMLISNTCWALWMVLQGRIIKSYPSKLLLTTLQCFLSSIQSLLIAAPFVKDPTQWRLGWNVKLVAVAYCGVVVTGVTYYLQSWIIEKRGPVFLAMSMPLNLVITTAVSALVLCEVVTLGSGIGGVLLIGGLYSVLWGKSKEQDIQCFEEVDKKDCSQVVKGDGDEEEAKVKEATDTTDMPV